MKNPLNHRRLPSLPPVAPPSPLTIPQTTENTWENPVGHNSNVIRSFVCFPAQIWWRNEPSKLMTLILWPSKVIELLARMSVWKTVSRSCSCHSHVILTWQRYFEAEQWFALFFFQVRGNPFLCELILFLIWDCKLDTFQRWRCE